MAEPDGRPPRDHRQISSRSAPAVMTIRTRFAYDDTASPDRPRRVARYHSDITDCGEFGSHATEYENVGDVFMRMVAAFGDDADLEVVVRPLAGGTDQAAQQND